MEIAVCLFFINFLIDYLRFVFLSVCRLSVRLSNKLAHFQLKASKSHKSLLTLYICVVMWFRILTSGQNFRVDFENLSVGKDLQQISRFIPVVSHILNSISSQGSFSLCRIQSKYLFNIFMFCQSGLLCTPSKGTVSICIERKCQ